MNLIMCWCGKSNVFCILFSFFPFCSRQLEPAKSKEHKVQATGMSKAKKQSSKSTSTEVWRSVEVYSYQSETVTTSTTVEEHYVSYQTAKPTKRK